MIFALNITIGVVFIEGSEETNKINNNDFIISNSNIPKINNKIQPSPQIPIPKSIENNTLTNSKVAYSFNKIKTNKYSY